MNGKIFDIKEFSVHDGPGGRITVFLKGCPLKCLWCHNPEGQSLESELMVKKSFCKGCGACVRNKESETYKKYGRDVSACPENLISVVGKEYTPSELADKIISYKPLLDAMGGGVTFSDGEPLMQYEFLSECADILRENGVHIALETCGFAKSKVFTEILAKVDYVMYDIKIMDSEKHKLYTGCPNEIILQNAELLKKSGVPFVFRTPMIPNITDTRDNLERIEEFTKGFSWEEIPYNELAGAKYPHLDRTYSLETSEKI